MDHGKMLWYPDDAFVTQTREEMLNEHGGYPGFERGIIQFHVVLAKVKASRGSIYRKATILLQRMVNVRVFKEGNQRTAYEVTDTFLRENGKRIKIANEQEVIRLIKNIKQHNIGQTEAWLENGKVP